MPLTSKKQRFADAKLAGLSNKEAAIKAGYSAATASPAGSRLVKDPDVVHYLKRKRPATGKATKKPAKALAPVAPPKGLPDPVVVDETDPLEFLKGVMSGRLTANITQVNAAKAMLPFIHQKLGEGGKKEKRTEAAKKVASRFTAAAPPKLVAAGGRKV